MSQPAACLLSAALLCTAAAPAPAQAPDGAPHAPTRLHAWAAGPHDAGLGTAIATPGDLDDDGVPDLLLGVPQLRPLPQSGPGLLRAVSGASGRLLFEMLGVHDGEAFGTAAARVGDWNGDGIDDLVVSAPRDDVIAVNGGTLRLHSGRNGELLMHPVPPPPPGHEAPAPDPVQMHGEEPFGELGTCLVSLPDLDGDGLADFAASAPSDEQLSFEPGYVLVMSTKTLEPLLAIWGDTRDEHFGAALVSVPDLDGDGVPELAVGAPTARIKGVPCGRVVVVSPKTGRTLHELKGEPGERFGAALATLPDTDGDGKPELLVGAPGAALRGPDAGAAHLVSIASGKRLLTLDGAAAYDGFGQAVATGDVDGDGATDLIVGAHGADGGGWGAGRVDVYSADGFPILSIQGKGAGVHLGWALASPGDLDGDGRAEVVAGQLAADDRAAPPGAVGAWAGQPAPETDAKGKRKKSSRG